VPDTEFGLIRTLDLAYREHINVHHRPPEYVTLRVVDPFLQYIPHVIKVREPVTKELFPVYSKPAWFVRRKPFVI